MTEGARADGAASEGEPFEPHRDLEAIRGLMERAREYRHPPAPAAFVAGLAGTLGGLATHGTVTAPGTDPAQQLGHLALLWGLAFGVALAAVVVFTSRAARREGRLFWSPLAMDVVHALWPSLVLGLALTVALARAGRLELVAPLWLLAYGAGGIAAGAFASPIVRRLGLAFLAAGLVQLALDLPPGLVLAATFGGFHVVYGLALAVSGRGTDAG